MGAEVAVDTMVTMEETRPLIETDRTRLRRAADRGSRDRALARTILDEAVVAHVGLVTERGPQVLPMAYGRVGDIVYLHGAVGNALLRGAEGADVCVTVTIVDGLVLARSGFHHSMNYRSLVMFGRADAVRDEIEKRRALDAVVDHMVPGRSADARPADPGELRATLVLRMPIEEASVKVRAHGAVDEEADMALDVWAGVVPMAMVAGEPVQQPEQVESHGDVLVAPTPQRLVRTRGPGTSGPGAGGAGTAP